MFTMKVKPANNFLLVLKCVNDHIRNEDGEVLIWRSDYNYDTTTFARVEAVGPKCKYWENEDVGVFVHCPEYANGLYNIGDGYWVVREDLVNASYLEE